MATKVTWLDPIAYLVMELGYMPPIPNSFEG
jgi:hypothetical protein